MKELIKIQRFSLNDGPGIRTTLFFKGCNLKCPYCCNPENTINNFNALKSDDIGYESKLFGKYYSVPEILKIILKDISYYDTDGGVTFSGGEPYIHADFILELCKKLKDKNIVNTMISTAVETSLVCDESNIKKLIDYIDMYIIDIKTLNFDIYRDYYKGDLNIFLNNIKLLKDKLRNAIFRITFVKGINDSEKDIELYLDFINKYKINNLEICSVHNLAENKYKKLSLDYIPFETINIDKLNIVKQKLSKACKNIKINHI